MELEDGVDGTELGGRFSAMEDREDSAAGPLQRTYLAESSAETSAERCRLLATVTKRKAKRSVTVEAKRAKREEEFKSRKHVLENLHKPGISFFWLPLNR